MPVDNQDYTLSEHTTSELHCLTRATKWADQQGMIFEFLDYFLSEYNKNGGDIYEAVACANREWDL